MFDVGFWELTIIALVALIVIGPERLPKVVRTVGLWIGRGRRLLADVKADIDKEIKAEELKEMLEKQTKIANPLHEIIEETQQDLNQIKQDVMSTKPETPPVDQSSAQVTHAPKQGQAE
jgi:sec-independent protein translocase protein TatB